MEPRFLGLFRRPEEDLLPKRRKPRRPGFWWAIFRWYARAAKRKIAAKVSAATGPKVVATASQDWSEGEFIRPVLQPYRLERYIAPEDMERYVVRLGGHEFELELLPDPTADLRRAAYDAAAAEWGVFVHSLPLELIEAANDRARVALPEPITA